MLLHTKKHSDIMYDVISDFYLYENHEKNYKSQYNGDILKKCGNYLLENPDKNIITYTMITDNTIYEIKKYIDIMSIDKIIIKKIIHVI